MTMLQTTQNDQRDGQHSSRRADVGHGRNVGVAIRKDDAHLEVPFVESVDNGPLIVRMLVEGPLTVAPRCDGWAIRDRREPISGRDDRHRSRDHDQGGIPNFTQSAAAPFAPRYHIARIIEIDIGDQTGNGLIQDVENAIAEHRALGARSIGVHQVQEEASWRIRLLRNERRGERNARTVWSMGAYELTSGGGGGGAGNPAPPGIRGRAGKGR